MAVACACGCPRRPRAAQRGRRQPQQPRSARFAAARFAAARAAAARRRPARGGASTSSASSFASSSASASASAAGAAAPLVRRAGAGGRVVAEARVVDLGARGCIATGRPFLDHMVDQLTAHAQLGVTLQVSVDGVQAREGQDSACDADDGGVYALAGAALGEALAAAVEARRSAGADVEAASATFAAPLDEAYAECTLALSPSSESARGLRSFSLAPYGSSNGGAGRARIGTYQTALTEPFFAELARASGFGLALRKHRGDNAHHIVESTFKAFARCLRRALDGALTADEAAAMAAAKAKALEEVLPSRRGARARATKETSVDIALRLDGRGEGSCETGIATLDAFLETLREASGVSATVKASGDQWIDDHHTAEDVAITWGQCLGEALGNKAGVNRMGSAVARRGESEIEVIMDLSNRPSLVNDLTFRADMLGDLSVEMVDHVLMSLAFNAGITLHVVTRQAGPDDMDRLLACAEALGECLKQCVDVDPRRAGAVASSKGTLSA